VLGHAGGTHADLTTKQKKQATAARVAYTPAPRWSAALSSAASDASSTTGGGAGGPGSVHSGGAPSSGSPAWVSETP